MMTHGYYAYTVYVFKCDTPFVCEYVWNTLSCMSNVIIYYVLYEFYEHLIVCMNHWPVLWHINGVVMCSLILWCVQALDWENLTLLLTMFIVEIPLE